tara:strand:- start:2323 stop:2739 length:417 start_codon:yes stop_codon:yes gene_type:complete
MTKRYISWEEIETLVNILYDNILESGKEFTHICGIPRGGLTPAIMLSHKMGIPYHSLSERHPCNETLFVDDICDSGETLQNLYEYYTAVLHYKPHTSKYEPRYYASKFTSNDWIVYPWENKDSKPIQDYKVINVLKNE